MRGIARLHSSRDTCQSRIYWRGGGGGGPSRVQNINNNIKSPIRVWKGESDPAFQLFFFSRESTLFPERWSSAISTVVFFSNSSLIHAQIFSNPAPQVAVKSHIPLTFSESRTVFWSNRGTREYPSTPCAIKPPKQNPGSIPFLFRW